MDYIRNWDNTLVLAKQGKIDFKKEILNGNTVVHLSCLNNQNKLIKYILNKDPSAFLVQNDDGDNPLHILAKYGNHKLLKTVVNKVCEAVDTLNRDQNTVTMLVTQNIDTLNFLIDSGCSDFNSVNADGETVITKIIENIDKKRGLDDPYYQTLEKIINKYGGSKIDYDKPADQPPLLVAVNRGLKHVIKLLLKSGADPDVKTIDFIAPVALAVDNNQYSITKMLIKSRADVNFQGPDGSQNLLTIAALNGNNDLVDLLIKKGINPNQHNRFGDTPLHTLLQSKNPNPTTVAQLVYYTDMNKHNIDGKTPQHLLYKKYGYRNFNKFLQTRRLDVYTPDSDGVRPIDLISSSDIPHFLKMVVNSFKSELGDKNFCKSLDKKECNRKIRKYILDNQQSYPTDNKKTELKSIVYPTDDYTNYGRFNSDTMHSMVYTILLLKKHKNLGIPFQFRIKDKVVDIRMKDSFLSLYKTEQSKVISSIVGVYTDYFFQLRPYIILWLDKDNYYIDKNLDMYLYKCIDSPKIRFIYIKLTLVASESGTHANLILIDKKNKTCERFDPYGVVPHMNIDQLDLILKDKFEKLNLKYLKPSDYMGGLSFQTLSNDSLKVVKRLGDPAGYCLAWTMWYIEVRIQNPDVKPGDLIKESINHIVKTQKHSEHRFMDFIRNYANNLDKEKNKYLEKVGIKTHDLYSIIFKTDDVNKLFKNLSDDFDNIVSKRYRLK